jgi:hypothetical protein
MRAKAYSRRDFSGLSVAAVAGLLTGSRAGRGQDSKRTVLVDPSLLLKDGPNVCRGLNTCKERGKPGHECAGRSTCATAPPITCNGNNDCKGKGGCGGYPGQNTCKGKGHCDVPLTAKTWEIARRQFEQMMKDQGWAFGAAPPGVQKKKE